MLADVRISAAHKEYLKKKKRRRVSILLTQWGLLISLIALWEILARVGVIDSFLISSPSRIVNTISNLAKSGELFTHLGVTLYETVIGFVIGCVIGLVGAILLWWSDYWGKVLDVYLVVLNSLPKIALGPVLIVWIGAGTKAIIAMAVLVSVVVTLVTVLTGFREVPAEKIFLLKSFGANKWQILTMVILPGSVPTIMSALKLSVGLTWVGVIVGEFLVSRAGLGYLIVYGGQVFKLDLVMASTAILCVCAVVMYFIVSIFEERAKKRM